MKRKTGLALGAVIIISFSASAEVWVIDSSTPTTSGNEYIAPGDSENTVYAENLDIDGYRIYAAKGGSPKNNTVSLSRVTVEQVYAGIVDNTKGSINASLSGNKLYVTNNSVITQNIAAAGALSNYQNAGVPGNIKADGNTLIIENSTAKDVSAANVGVGTSASNNYLRITGSSTGMSVGGWVWDGVANNNTVYIESSNTGRVIGGWGAQTNNNTVTIVNSTVGDVYVGEVVFLENDNGSSKNNKLKIIGATNIYGGVYGGLTSKNGGTPTNTYDREVVEGNTLFLNPTTQRIYVNGNLVNFTDVEFDFSDFPTGDTGTMSGGDEAIWVGGIANLIPGGTITNIKISGTNHESGRLILIKSNNPIYFDGKLTGSMTIPGLGYYDFIGMTHLLLDNEKTLAVDYGLNWYFNNTLAHGTFTINSDESYLFSTVLNDRNPVPPNDANWNGKSLTKKGTGTLILEEANTYTGTTNIEAGTLQLGDGGTSGSLDSASVVTIGAGATLSFNRTDNLTATDAVANVINGLGAVTQIGSGQLELTGANTYSGGTNINTGTLLIQTSSIASLGSGDVRNSANVLFSSAAGNFSNTITGSGDVTFSNSANVRLLAGLTASDITIDVGSKATIASTNPVEGNIVDNGVLAVDVASDYVLNGPISGAGVLEQNGSGRLLLTRTNSYMGGTNVNAGTLAINNTGAVGSGAVYNNAAFMFTGAVGEFSNPISGAGNVLFSNASNINITGALSAGDVNIDSCSTAGIAAGQTWTVNNLNNAGQFRLVGDGVSATVAGNVTNSGQLRLDHDGLGSELSITGNYVGNNGSVWLNTQLDDDDSASDLLKIAGTASGKTEVRVRNIDGEGNDTLVGIRIIETGASARDTFYLKDGYVAAGAYDYSLFRREENAGVNWYLSNGFDEDGDGDVDPEAGPTYTPGLGSVIANTIASNALFSMRFEDREGAGQSQLGAKTENNLWVRYSGGNNKFRALNSQLHTSGHSSAMQIGVGLPSLLESHSIDLGVMAGYGHYKGNTTSSRTDRKSSSVVDGYSVGLYGTWYSNPASQSGVYVDSWLLWNHFNNRITGADDNKYSYKSKGITASIEVGKGYELGELNGADIWMQPQAQVIYQGVRADKVTDAQDVTAKRGSANVQLRAGVKTYADDIMLGNMSSRPFVEVNYIHNTDHYSVKIDDSTYRAAGGKNIGEIRLGLEGNVAGSHQMWINTGYADGGKHYSDFSIQAGWKYQF